MLDTLISSKTRIKLLVRLFLNPDTSAYLRGLADDFEESTNAVRVELNRFEDAGMVCSESQGNKKVYKANDKHPLFKDLQNIILKYMGIDRIIETIIGRIGRLDRVYLSGSLAEGKDSGIIDLVFIGGIDKNYLLKLIEKAEKLIHKKIRYLVYDTEEWEQALQQNPSRGKLFLLWKQELTEENKTRKTITSL